MGLIVITLIIKPSLSLCHTDSIREMKRYSLGKESDSEHGHLDAELQHSMKLFRAQRNFYVAGFALFLYLYVSADLFFQPFAFIF